MRVAFCTVLFAPAGRLATYQEFKRQFDKLNVPLFVAELSFDGSFDTHELGIKEVADERNILWQKEALLNRLVESLPSEYDTVVFVDCDMVWPEDVDWIGAAEKQLKVGKRAVQLFEKTLYFDKEGGVSSATYGWAAHKERYNPGGAWMVRRELFPLIDYMVVGGGDRVMAEGWAGLPLSRTDGFKSNWPLMQRLKKDMAFQYKKCQGKIGYVHTPNFHLYHGEIAKRKYHDRFQGLGDYWFNPDTDIAHEQGILAWTPNARPALREFVKNYFVSRTS